MHFRGFLLHLLLTEATTLSIRLMLAPVKVGVWHNVANIINATEVPRITISGAYTHWYNSQRHGIKLRENITCRSARTMSKDDCIHHNVQISDPNQVNSTCTWVYMQRHKPMKVLFIYRITPNMRPKCVAIPRWRLWIIFSKSENFRTERKYPRSPKSFFWCWFFLAQTFQAALTPYKKTLSFSSAAAVHISVWSVIISRWERLKYWEENGEGGRCWGVFKSFFILGRPEHQP